MTRASAATQAHASAATWAWATEARLLPAWPLAVSFALLALVAVAYVLTAFGMLPEVLGTGLALGLLAASGAVFFGAVLQTLLGATFG